MIQKKYCFILVGLILFLFPVYSNTLYSQWQLDDVPNIIWNTPLHLKALDPGSLFQTFFAHPNGGNRLYRPLPCLTFALNWYFGEDNPFGYHLTNLLLHVLTAFVLFLTIYSIFQTPRLRGAFSPNQSYFISLLTATLWTVNPIQTQAVTYIVQRMTVMAALFYILGLFFYINARISNIPLNRNLLFLACFFSFLCALGSKENAATFPLAVLLLELTFFQDLKTINISTLFLKSALAILLLLLVAYFFSKGDLLFFQKGYAGRPYDLTGRLLTQPRVLIFYLSLIFYPLPQRLSIDHEFAVSKSLIDPWTTLLAIFGVAFLLTIGFFTLKKRPLLGFPILFFFANHLIESTLIPLEMTFEHRNYLPSTFLFLPVSLGLNRLITSYRERKKWPYHGFVVFCVLWIISLGIGTYTRNNAWVNPLTLWTDAAYKAPGNARPISTIATEIGWRHNATDQDRESALALLKKSLNLYITSKFVEAGILANIGALYFKKNDLENALAFYSKAIEKGPDIRKIRYDLALELAKLGKWEDSSRHLDIVLEKRPKIERYYSLKGFVLLWLNKPKEALSYLREALNLDQNKSSTWLNIGVALNQAGSLENAHWFFKMAKQRSGPDMIPLYYIVENRILANDISTAKRYAQNLFLSTSVEAVIQNLKYLRNNYRFPPIKIKLVLPVIKDAALNIANEVK